MIRTTAERGEQGFATLVVAITLVIILSLLTLGFAQLMRSEQNQATDRQLSNQAYYAAEAGINDALRALQADSTVTKTTCGPDASNKYLADNNVDTTAIGSNGADQWTCLLIDPSPTSLEYSPVDTVTPTVFIAQAVDSNGSGTPLSSLTFSWKDSDNAANPQFRPTSGVSNASFPPGTAWNSIGMVRVALSPLGIGGGTFTRTNLIGDTVTAFLYPSTARCTNYPNCLSDNYLLGLANPQAAQSQQGQILDGDCTTGNNTAFYCQAKIVFNPVLPAGTQVEFNLRSIYAKTHVYIVANDGNAHLDGAQVLIDSTGRSQDILKRIEVRVPDQGYYDYPGFSVDSSGSICKQLRVYPGFASGCGY